MRTMRINHRPRHGGRVWTMAPSAGLRDAVAAATPGGYQPSYMQADHLAGRLANPGAQDGLWIGLVYQLEHPADVDAFARAYTRWVRRHGVMWGWFEASEQAPTGFVRYDVTPEQLEYVAEEGPLLSSPDQVAQFVLTDFRTACNPLGKFGYACHVVSGEDATTVFLGTDHSYTDGFSHFTVFYELHQLYREECTGEPAQLIPVGNFMDFAQQERARMAETTVEHPAVSAWGDFYFDGEGELGRFPLDLGVTFPQTAELEKYGLDVMTEVESELLDVVAAEHAVTVPSLMYAAAALAAKELADATTFRFINPLHTRDADEWLMAAGWFITIVPIHIDIDPADDLWSLAAKMRSTFRTARPVGQVPAILVYHLIEDALGMKLTQAGERHLFSYMDVRAVPGSDLWEDIDGTLVSAGAQDSNVACWMFRAPGRMHIEAICPSTDIARVNIDRFYQHMRVSLRTAAGLTTTGPGDVDRV